MARLVTIVVAVAGGVLMLAEDALAMHHYDQDTLSSSWSWATFGLWSGIGVAVVLLVAWLVFEARRHHWLPPHRPVHTS